MNSDVVGSLLPLIVLFAIFYFMIIRPQQKQQKEHQDMLDNLQKGDQVVTNGGLVLEIASVEGNYFIAKTHDGAKVKIVKSYIASKWEE